MPRIFDNIDLPFLPTLSQTLQNAIQADFCVGYFNLRGWKEIDTHLEHWAPEQGQQCRVLVGMQRPGQDELRLALSLTKQEEGIDSETAVKLKKRLAEEFREQLLIGAPTNQDEAALRRLSSQIKAKKVAVKLFLRHTLHAKLYLVFQQNLNTPIVGFLGSSNLTLAGLSHQGELNIDVLDGDACQKLARWFEDRWNDRWCLDISNELVQIIDESWARETILPPYYIYLKMAFHLAQEARTGLAEFQIPSEFQNTLFEFQKAAVKIAAHHLNKRNGVLIGDVVGLGKTLMATALVQIFENDFDLEALIICPKNLVKMWEEHRERYGLRGKVLSLTRVTAELPVLRRYRLVVIDESHNLRNQDGKRYKAIQDYFRKNESKCVLLSATPYNKTYLDLAAQLGLFIPEDKNLGIRPENLLREMGLTAFEQDHQCPVHSLAAFEKSEHPDDWRELMRLFLVRRTRSFIQNNYAQTDAESGRRYLTFEDGSRSYFPHRLPKTVKFTIDDSDPNDQYARLYADEIVKVLDKLTLPRYGLGNYVAAKIQPLPGEAEKRQLQNLSRAGKRLMGFCRTNLFKRLESSGQAFIQSLERHILRNFIFLHAIEAGQPLPIGTQGAELLDSRVTDADVDDIIFTSDMFEDDGEPSDTEPSPPANRLRSLEDYQQRAAEVYALYTTEYQRRFKWLSPRFFTKSLAKDLKADAIALHGILEKCGDWNPNRDAKLDALFKLLTEHHSGEKVLIFTQFADTVRYLEGQLQSRFRQNGLDSTKISGVTGDSADPTGLAWRFSPVSNQKRNQVPRERELQVLVATDVLSEGQNLQDAWVIVNYDLPWAIIRLIQRAGRVDRIGQQSDRILCYSFLPAEGVERIIGLRKRIVHRLKENAEVVGTDEVFFEDDRGENILLNLYHEKAGILDTDDDTEIDLVSYAYQIWKNAIAANPNLHNTITGLDNVVFSTKAHQPSPRTPEGVLLYLRTPEGNDALAWVDQDGHSVTESQFAILRAAECTIETPALPRLEKHHELVQAGVSHIAAEEKRIGGQLGRPTSARYRTYERLKRYAESLRGTLFESKDLLKVLEDIYRYPLRQSASETLNRQLRSGISDPTLAELAIALRDEDQLCIIHDEDQTQEPRIICSLGLSGRVET